MLPHQFWTLWGHILRVHKWSKMVEKTPENYPKYNNKHTTISQTSQTQKMSQSVNIISSPQYTEMTEHDQKIFKSCPPGAIRHLTPVRSQQCAPTRSDPELPLTLPHENPIHTNGKHTVNTQLGWGHEQVFFLTCLFFSRLPFFFSHPNVARTQTKILTSVSPPHRECVTE